MFSNVIGSLIVNKIQFDFKGNISIKIIRLFRNYFLYNNKSQRVWIGYVYMKLIRIKPFKYAFIYNLRILKYFEKKNFNEIQFINCQSLTCSSQFHFLEYESLGDLTNFHFRQHLKYSWLYPRKLGTASIDTKGMKN